MAENIVIANLTWTEVDEALKDRPVALLPVGATEAHGPHLTLSADTVIAHEAARRAAAKLKLHGVPALILPALPYSVCEYASGFPGTLGIGVETAALLLRDVAVAASKRFRAVAFVNVHLEPLHLEALKKGVELARAAGVSVTCPDITKKRWAETLGQAFLQGDHGGAFETSLVMAASPESVRERERISLPPMEGMNAAMKKGAKTFAEAGAEDGYFGDPTAASAEDGKAIFEALGKILSISIVEHLGSKA